MLGNKAAMIKPLHNRRKADVLISTIHKKYNRFEGVGRDDYVTGISFYKADGVRVVNFPVQHRENLVAKNQSTNEWFKHIIRIFKNARQKLIERGAIEAGVAPSYYIEGLLYNVPSEKFGSSYDRSMFNVINWLLQANRATFVCANEQYLLLDDNADVSWNAQDCDAFLAGLIDLWNRW